VSQRITEKKWLAIAPVAFITDGDEFGLAEITSTSGFKTKQKVILKAIGEPSLHLEIKKVVSGNLLLLGPRNSNIKETQDISAYTVAKSSTVEVPEQPRSAIPDKEYGRAVYEEEPTVALRTLQVDQFGDFITSENIGEKRALDVNVAGGNIVIDNPEINVELDATSPDGDSVRAYGVDSGGTQRQVLVDDTGKLQTIIFGKTEANDIDNIALSNSNSVKIAITDRPSEVRNRASILIHIPDTLLTGAGTTLYTITSGKILYIHSFFITQLNAANAIGSWTLNDSSTILSTFLLPQRTSGTLASASSAISPTMQEPLAFSINIRAIEVSGDMRISGFMLGYEE
jgi:hypothetical protein